ncbi:MAG TPA: acetolactate synthase small subunit [Acidimicrobiales bacterium]|nr:acetolactate synthase small subunit [Acidimicrobiales bacterium]
MTRARHHTLTVLVENKPGVLSRVANLFSRRGYNIFSLAVAPTDDPAFSRITVVVDVESAPLEQIVKQLFKLINVVKISELDPEESCERELLLVTVRSDGDTRGQIVQLAGIFDGRIVDVSHQSLTIAVTGEPSRVDDFEELMRAYGIVELQRSGRVALPRLERQAARLRSVATGKVG